MTSASRESTPLCGDWLKSTTPVPPSDLTPEPGSSYGLQLSPFRDLFGSRTPVADVEDSPLGEPVKFTETRTGTATVECVPYRLPNFAELESKSNDRNRGFAVPPPTGAALKHLDPIELPTTDRSVAVDAEYSLDRQRDVGTEQAAEAAQTSHGQCQAVITVDAVDRVANFAAGAAATDCAEVAIIRIEASVADDLQYEPDAVLSCRNETYEFAAPADAVPAGCQNLPSAPAATNSVENEYVELENIYSTVSGEVGGQAKRKIGSAYSQETVSLSIVRQTVPDLVYREDETTRSTAVNVKQENLVLRPAKVLARSPSGSAAPYKPAAQDSVSCTSSAGESLPSAFKPVQASETTEKNNRSECLQLEAAGESTAELAGNSTADWQQSNVLRGRICICRSVFIRSYDHVKQLIVERQRRRSSASGEEIKSIGHAMAYSLWAWLIRVIRTLQLVVSASNVMLWSVFDFASSDQRWCCHLRTVGIVGL